MNNSVKCKNTVAVHLAACSRVLSPLLTLIMLFPNFVKRKKQNILRRDNDTIDIHPN